ncbi:DNA/RNA nuclease SfsA [Alteromonas gilva]|uniref:Sugar fermentation stimulation protein homolog n=1 Tax=Alteromonas gilva TaxID=2987522 RepID=A0ABT5KYU4_9ALTE|nr:DNA/RNA nuclease SfsA [Alteromonas gilva]MDC8829945.1 DNA/RNA nuclease SfsA [Alteromonas gilva]
MQFTSPLLRGTLLRRYKRFFADIELDTGEQITAHCPNTGAMTGCAEPGFTVYVSPANNPKRKLKFTWELAVTSDNHWIGINTHHANKLVQEVLEQRPPSVFGRLQSIRREVTPPSGSSRFDFCLTRADDSLLYVEVKSVTLEVARKGYFPDAVTQRGQKHALELAELAKQGIATGLFFCVQHTGIDSVHLAEHIDPVYADAVRHAAQAGVDIVAMGCQISQEKIVLNQQLPIIL